ncbi:SDR family NAD(P)-dependent oxidoreductase [Paenibacillus soyae]|uniref:SDR family NAD(P)-dependent oxidoreductase n=1 Tax=Paenibacillus soyae TaxID=2969249 RepID=A0A9X2MPL8_9BACL|nr:SDR family NAD(P)-dependent oxidoreductase [Paenibacillus soyae]MCR2803538.1 SDR family NAD(P)-dependent oxidoreductase [Paenibacillus soyae]
MNQSQYVNIAFITGASSGIGLELTRKLLSEQWQVVALNRSDFPADDRPIQEAINNGLLRVYKTADLADYASLRESLEAIKQKESQIDILFNNAGGSFPELRYSKQGREMHYELMTVVPYIILMELKELLYNGRFKTVINTSSSAHQFTKALNIEMLERPSTFRKLIGPYASSKLALSLWTQAVAPQLAKEDIKIRSVDPGGNNTIRKETGSGLPLLVKAMMKLFYPPPSHGADLLHEGALGMQRNETGVFLQRGRVAKLKFADQAQNVLSRVNTIYEEDFRERTI